MITIWIFFGIKMESDHHVGHRICEEMVGKAETMVGKFGENGR